MESLTTRQAADALGVSVTRWHKLVKRHGIAPIFRAPGITGAMFWSPDAVETLRSKRDAEAA